MGRYRDSDGPSGHSAPRGQVVHLASVARVMAEEPAELEGPVPTRAIPAVREAETHARYVQENLVFLRQSFEEVLRLLRSVPVNPDGGVRPSDWAGLRAALRRLEPSFLQDEIPQALAESIQGMTRIKLILHTLRRAAVAAEEDE